MDNALLASLLLDLCVVGLTAMLAGWVCKRLEVPEVLGYLAAGVALAPMLAKGGGSVDSDIVTGIGSFAVVFRMFLLGLDFDPRRLKGRWRPGLTAGLLEMGLATAGGVVVALVLHWPILQGAVLGAALGTTSTSILSKALTDRNMSAREDARAAGAATLTEDLIAMTMLAGLTVFGSSGHSAATVAENALWLVVFASLAFTAGAIFVPIGLDRLGRIRSEELMTVAVIGILFGFAALSLSLRAGAAVGAFLAGIAVGAARHAPGLSQRVIPLRDMLVPISYVGMGLNLQLATIVAVAPLALVLVAIFVVVKVVAVTIGLRLGGVPTVTAARAGAILGQAGTMGIVYAVGMALDQTKAFAPIMAMAFVAWAITVALTPARLRWGPDITERIARALGASDRIEAKRKLPHGGGAIARASTYSLLLALGCSLALAALAGLAARAGDLLLGASLARPALLVAAAAVVGVATVPFAVAAGTSGRRIFYGAAHRAALGPERLARRRGERSRAYAHAGAALSLLLGLVAPAAMLAVIAPTATLPMLGVGFGVGLALAFVRPSMLSRLVERCERLVTPRRSEPMDARMHDFRGLNPFGYEVEAVLVRAGTVPEWRTLRELAIPERTGARVLAVIRPGTHDSAPLGPDTALHPGDEVVLGGGGAALVNARRLLLEARSAPLVRDSPTHDGHVDGDVQRGARVA